MRSLSPLVAVALFAAAPAAAQTAAEEIARGIEAHENRDPRGAYERFAAALALEPASYEADWRAAESLVDVGKQTPDTVKSTERDSLYAEAEKYARAAVAANPDGADGHYTLALAVGRASLTKSKKERVRRASEILNEVNRALELNPEHDKAYHLLGRWHAEIMRLSGLTRFFAKTFLGGKVFNEASWDKAIANLERSVGIAPQVIYHHLDLAEVLIDRKRYSEARIHLNRVGDLPVVDVMDPSYKQDAERLLRRIEGKKDG
jgi:tetratricopeptide (TPR) repeat protein